MSTIKILPENRVGLKFDGQLSQIDVKAFISTVEGFCDTLQIVNKHFNAVKELEIKVDSVKKGSFEINLILSCDPSQLWAGVTGISTAVIAVCQLYKFKQWLADRKLKSTKEEDGTTTIEDVNGDVKQIASRLYGIHSDNKRVDRAMTKSFAYLAKDPNVKIFVIKLNEEELFSASGSEFNKMAKQSPSKPEERLVRQKENLVIDKVVFENRKQAWGFIYRGIKINAKIQDENFFDNFVDQRAEFAKGDQLQVELEITQRIHPKAQVYQNIKYSILKATKHIKHSHSQITLMDE